MAKKEEVKMTKTEIIDKVMDTLNVLVIPVSTIIAIWGSFDASVYVAGAVAAVNGVLEYIKICLNK